MQIVGFIICISKEQICAFCWDRNDVLPDDGPVGPKHVGVILKLILICVEGFKV